MATDRHAEFLALWATFTILTTVVLALRFYVRIAVVRQFGYDDFAMVFAAIWHVLILMVGFNMSHFGMGRHIYDISKLEAMGAIKWAIFEPTISAFCMAFVKTSLCLLLIRIGVSRGWQIVLVSLIGISFIDTVVDATVFLNRCTPLQSNWNHAVPKNCHYSLNVVNNNHYIATGAFAIVTDILLSLAPALMLWKLRMQLGTRLLLIGLFGLGLLSTICNIVRTVLTVTITDASLKDFTYNMAPIAIWAFLECQLAIIAACIPSLRALCTQSSFFRATTGQTYGQSASTQIISTDIKVVTSVEWGSDKASSAPNLEPV